MSRLTLILGLFLCTAYAQAQSSAPRSELLIISGIGGETYYSELFQRWGSSMVDAASQQLGLPMESITWLAENPAIDSKRIGGRSDKATIQTSLKQLSIRTQGQDQTLVLLIGHGSAQGKRVLFNIPGPDISMEELGLLLDDIPGKVALVNAASSSGPFVQSLSRSGRIVITATSNTAENQHARFGGYFVSAFQGLAADSNKDGRISLLEAYAYTNRQVKRSFEDQRLIQTEHALLDDNGDGKSSPTQEGLEGDGVIASNWYLAAQPLLSARRFELQAAANNLVDEIERLKRDKPGLTEGEFKVALEDLLIELAINRRTARNADHD